MPARPGDISLHEQEMDGVPVYLGRLVSAGTSVNNSTTATPFGASDTLRGLALCIVPTVAGHVAFGTSTSTAATADYASMPVTANTPVSFRMPSTYSYIAFIPASGAGNCSVFQLV